MKMNEITNAVDQLQLLRTIIDNTWAAIKQQADAQAKQKAAQPARPQKVKPIKKAPYAAQPKPLPRPNQQQPQPKLGKPALNQVPRDNLGAPKGVASKSLPQRSSEEMRTFIDYLKGDKAKTAQVNQNQGFLPN